MPTSKKRVSELLNLGAIYTREELRHILGTEDATINTGVFRPKGFDSVLLFVTKQKTSDRTQYKDELKGENLYWQGQSMGRTDRTIIEHRQQMLELLVLYRDKKYQYAHAGFRYEGPFSYVSHHGAMPASFVLKRTKAEIGATLRAQTILVTAELAPQLKLPSAAAESATVVQAQSASTAIEPHVVKATHALPASDSIELEEAMAEAEAAGAFDPSNLEDARKKTLAAIVRRQGQPGFRRALMRAYDKCCAISGCDIPQVLEAAHIVPYQGPQTNHVSNGLLMRADLHTLFDLGLLAIKPHSKTVVVAPALRSTEYGLLHGKTLRLPLSAADQPSEQALRQHYSSSALGL